MVVTSAVSIGGCIAVRHRYEGAGGGLESFSCMLKNSDDKEPGRAALDTISEIISIAQSAFTSYLIKTPLSHP